MAKKVPFYADYKTIGIISTVADWVLYLSVATAVGSLLIELNQFPNITGNWQELLTGASCFFSILYFCIDLLSNYLFQCAESHRRNDFFDNSLSTVLSNENSEEYFTNDNIRASIYKLGVNCFENSLFTHSIARRYLQHGLFPKTVIVFIIFLLAALFGGNRILVIILQLALPLTIIQQTIRLFYFKNRLGHIYDCFMRIFAMPQGDKQDSLLIHSVTNYEATLAWACIKLPDATFKKLNSSLSTQWVQIKQRLNIQ
jgi:hypothetical protein